MKSKLQKWLIDFDTWIDMHPFWSIMFAMCVWPTLVCSIFIFVLWLIFG